MGFGIGGVTQAGEGVWLLREVARLLFSPNEKHSGKKGSADEGGQAVLIPDSVQSG